MTPRVESVISRTDASADIAEILGTGDVVSRARRMFADESPVLIATSYIPADIAEGTVLEQQNTGPGRMISRMAELGYEQVRMHERVTARPPTDDEAEFLQMPAGQHVFVILHVGYTADGRAMEAAVHTLQADRWELDYDWTLDATA
jgi:GntR family transcriptional regulator